MLERRLHLRRLDAARDACIDDAGFLAALGALWLDDGDAEQARTWLERALMLDPDQPGALADHALALAALGEPTALRDLARAWAGRADVPAALRTRILAAAEPGARLRLPLVALGREPSSSRGPSGNLLRSASRGEAAVLLGYDDNLDFLPRLRELELTAPEGPVVLPVDTVPRRGMALRAEVLWQAAWLPAAGRTLRAGLSALARHSPGRSDTDWHQLQAAASYAGHWNGWTALVQVESAWFGGPLAEPYALWRGRAGLEHQGADCRQLVQLEAALRRQRRTHSADSQAVQAGWRLHCQPEGHRDWSWTLDAYGLLDEPRQDDRPGGRQRGQGLTLRVEHRPDALHRIELSVGGQRLRDREGYSPLLEDNAVRWQQQLFVNLEAARELGSSHLPGAELVLRLGHYRQTSNLTLFERRGSTVYAGLRWPW
ncbi:MAG: hypothetical protein LC119_05065 [Burkholderiales bacterium]|nr:hypothetical protein [Burkholderiales bacterium]